MIRYRVGAHWGVTVVEYDDAEIPDIEGRRRSDRLVCMAVSPEDAEYIVTALTIADPAEVDPS